jgi:DNA repair protein RecO (recombination protein O)
MPILKTDAVVLRGWKMGETSLILSLYTRDFGKIRVVVKGARSPKSRFKGCLESLSHIRIVYYDKDTRDLQLLSQADLINPHVRIIGDCDRTALGLASSELIDRAVLGRDPFPPVFDLLVSTLDALDRRDGFQEAFFWFFESRFIELMGYKPTWHCCLVCGTSLGFEGGYFQPQNGGLLCRACGSTKGGLDVPGETLEILFWLQKTDADSAGHLKPNAVQKNQIRRMFDLYFKTHIENMKGLQALKIFEQLEDNSADKSMC